MKNSLACVTFNGKKSTMFAIILRQLEKWEIYQNISFFYFYFIVLIKYILPESNGCSIVLKANYF
jgi:hypothetical protein